MGGKISRQPHSFRHMAPTLVSPWERQSRWKAEMKWRSKVNSMIRFLIKDKALITSKALKTTLNVSWKFRVHVSINCTCHGVTCTSKCWCWEMLLGIYPGGCAAGHLPGPGRQSWQPAAVLWHLELLLLQISKPICMLRTPLSLLSHPGLGSGFPEISKLLQM